MTCFLYIFLCCGAHYILKKFLKSGETYFTMIENEMHKKYASQKSKKLTCSGELKSNFCFLLFCTSILYPIQEYLSHQGNWFQPGKTTLSIESTAGLHVSFRIMTVSRHFVQTYCQSEGTDRSHFHYVFVHHFAGLLQLRIHFMSPYKNYIRPCIPLHQGNRL